jgi:spore cortex formation protein SpoVR/YcgB (stage V sporulation)
MRERCNYCDSPLPEFDSVHTCMEMQRALNPNFKLPEQPADDLDQFFKKQRQNEVNQWRAEIIKNIRDVKVCLEDEDCEAALEIINQMLGEG